MKLTDEDLKKIFPFGASIVDQGNEDALPIWGKLEPHEENPDWMNLWITDGANTVLPREVEPEGDHYVIQHHSRPHTLVALPEDRDGAR